MSDRDNERIRQRYVEDPEYRERRRAAVKAWQTANKEKINAEQRLRWVTDTKFRKRRLKSGRNATLKLKYGITSEDYDRMFKKQKGRCAICREKSHRRLHVDHDHKKKFVRRLLCGLCNRGLGCFRDDMRLMARGLAYLKAMAKAYRQSVKGRRNRPKKRRGGRKRKR
jgi:hypothetical protein